MSIVHNRYFTFYITRTPPAYATVILGVIIICLFILPVNVGKNYYSSVAFALLGLSALLFLSVRPRFPSHGRRFLVTGNTLVHGRRPVAKRARG